MKSLFTLLLITLFVHSYAQEKNQQVFFHEIGFDYGIFASLNSAEHENYLGNKYTLHTTNYYLENFKYYSESGFDQGYKPKWFMNASVGLSFQF